MKVPGKELADKQETGAIKRARQRIRSLVPILIARTCLQAAAAATVLRRPVFAKSGTRGCVFKKTSHFGGKKTPDNWNISPNYSAAGYKRNVNGGKSAGKQLYKIFLPYAPDTGQNRKIADAIAGNR